MPIPNSAPDGIKLLLQLCFNLKPRNRPTFSQIIKHLEIVSNTEVIFKLEDEYLKNQLEWKDEIKERMDFKKEFNSQHLKLYNLDDLVQKRKEELKHATSIRELYEQKLEKANNLYFELNTVLLQLDEREKEVIRREKALNIHNSRIVRPIVKREFKNRAQTYIQRNSENKANTSEEKSESSFEKSANTGKSGNVENKIISKNKPTLRRLRSKSVSCNEEPKRNDIHAAKEKNPSKKSKKISNQESKKYSIENSKHLEKFLVKTFKHSKKASLKDTVKSLNTKVKQQKLHFVRKNSMKQKTNKYQEKLRQVFKYMLMNMNEVC